MKTIGLSNRLYEDQARRLVGPYLGPICLQSLSADGTSRHSAKHKRQAGMTIDVIFPFH